MVVVVGWRMVVVEVVVMVEAIAGIYHCVVDVLSISTVVVTAAVVAVSVFVVPVLSGPIALVCSGN